MKRFIKKWNFVKKRRLGHTFFGCELPIYKLWQIYKVQNHLIKLQGETIVNFESCMRKLWYLIWVCDMKIPMWQAKKDGMRLQRLCSKVQKAII